MASGDLYPAVRVEAAAEPRPSRWLWLVKWLLGLPHYLVLAVLWPAFAVLTAVAFFAILVTARYPRPIFEFNLGVLRWTWRVHYYAYAALGTDQYPPFTLAEVPDYPARLDIAYPERLSRGLVLVKWWLLALPHYLVVGLFAGGGLWLGGGVGRDEYNWGAGGLIGLLVLIAGVVLAVTGRYPRPIYDFVLGMDRWVIRVGAYAALMTDDYPPFRLDMGPHDPAGVPDHHEPPPSPTGWTAGRIVSVVAGAVLALAAAGPLTAGAALLWADRVERDADGYLSTSESVTAAGVAVTSERIELAGTSADWAPARWFAGDVRVRAVPVDPAREVFVGVAPSYAVDRYLAGVEHTTLTDPFDGVQVVQPGVRVIEPPGVADIWTAEASGPGARAVSVPIEVGSWTAVVMNADGSPGIQARIEAGATVPALGWIALALLSAGALLLAVGTVLIVVPLNRVTVMPKVPSTGD